MTSREALQDALDEWARANLPTESAGCITSWSDWIAAFVCDGVFGDSQMHPLSDIRDLDEVVRELGIQDSSTTPAEAVRELNAEIERLRSVAQAAQEPAIAQRNSMVLVRNAIVMAIAFLGRDAGTERMETTLPQITTMLSNADAEIRRLIDGASVSSTEPDWAATAERARAASDRVIADARVDPADLQKPYRSPVPSTDQGGT